MTQTQTRNFWLDYFFLKYTEAVDTNNKADQDYYLRHIEKEKEATK